MLIIISQGSEGIVSLSNVLLNKIDYIKTPTINTQQRILFYTVSSNDTSGD